MLAIIPARGGSIGLPGKNTKLLQGKPLIAHTIEHARNAKSISRIIVNKPVVLKSQRLLDFGKGFYTTSNQNQAERWAVIKKNRLQRKSKSIVTIYQISEKLFSNKNYKIKEFSEPNEEWLDFVFVNRKIDKTHNYDIIIGPVANDTLYATLSLYEANLLTKEETIKRLKVHKLYDQISFHNNIVIKELMFFNSYEIFS